MKFIWATRGKNWGFRFLLDGGYVDPLEMYENAFEGNENQPSVYQSRHGLTAVRLEDPEGRVDRAGRVIQHDFVFRTEDANEINNMEDARALLWPMISEKYARIWEVESPKF